MAARSRSRSPTRKVAPVAEKSKSRSASKVRRARGKVATFEEPVVTISRSPSRVAAKPAKVDSPIKTRMSRLKKFLVEEEPYWLTLLRLLSWASVFFMTSCLFVLHKDFASLLSKYAEYPLRNFFLAPLGLGSMKPRGVIVLLTLIHALLTWLVMSVACAISMAIIHKANVEQSEPRIQRTVFGGLVHRINAAQSNLIEGLVLWLLASSVAFTSAVSDTLIMHVCTLYLVLRFLYTLSYVSGWAFLRTCFFMGGFGSCVGLMIHALAKLA